MEHESKEHESFETVDFRGVKCPLNFVKTRLALEKIPVGGVLKVYIDPDSDSALNVPNSLVQEGHRVVAQWETDVALVLWVERQS